MPERNSKFLIDKQEPAEGWQEQAQEEQEVEEVEANEKNRASKRIESHRDKQKQQENKWRRGSFLSNSGANNRSWRRWRWWRRPSEDTTSGNNFYRGSIKRPIGRQVIVWRNWNTEAKSKRKQRRKKKKKRRRRRRTKCKHLPCSWPSQSLSPSFSPLTSPPQRVPPLPPPLAPPPDENESPAPGHKSGCTIEAATTTTTNTTNANANTNTNNSNNNNNNNNNNHCPPYCVLPLELRQGPQLDCRRAATSGGLLSVSSDMIPNEHFGCEQERRQVVAALDNDKEAAPHPPQPRSRPITPRHRHPPPPAPPPPTRSLAHLRLHHQFGPSPSQPSQRHEQQCTYDQQYSTNYMQQASSGSSSSQKQQQASSRVKKFTMKSSFILALYCLIVQQQATIASAGSGGISVSANPQASNRHHQKHSLLQTARDQESSFEETTNRIDSLLVADSYATPGEARANRRPLDFIKASRVKQWLGSDRSRARAAATLAQQQVGNDQQEAAFASKPQHRHRRQQQQQQQPHHDQYRAHQRQHGSGQAGRLKRHNSLDGYDYLDSGGADRPLVATNKGLVRGITQKIFTGKFVDAFLGIPFAQPPVGAYRFKHPQPVNPWPGEFDASRMSNSCYQVNDTFFGANFMGTSIWNANTPLDEDCLYLNIWTPFGVANTSISPPPRPGPSGASGTSDTATSGNQNRNSFGHSAPAHQHHQKQLEAANQSNNSGGGGGGGGQDAKRPVLVWIFGGGFYSGTSTLRLYEGGALASEEDIIVVSMNYRVSALGFLYFGRPDAPGNAGLFDQLLALQWINDNIGQFGGDPQRVTIFGESAGAVSVAFHLLSPLSRNLFSQAILQSGAATCPWGSMDTREIVDNGLQLAALLKCPSDRANLDAVIGCLLKVDPMALVSQEVGQTRSVINFPFVPVVDGSFLLEPPAESLANTNFKRARILLGSNNDEANAFLVYLPEFSHCPSGGGGGGGGATTGTSSSASTDNSDTNQAASSNSAESPDLSESSAAALSMAPATDNSSENTHSSPSSNSKRDASSSATSASGSSSASGLQSTKTNQKQQQQVYAQNDSEPCKPNEYLSLNRDTFLEMLRENLNPYAAHPIAKKAIVFEYSNWNNPQDPVSYYDAIDKIVGDYYFTCNVNEFAQHYAQAGNAVYMYYFKHRSSMSPWPKWMGVLHADEINFVFGEPLNPVYNYTYKEIELSRRMMRYWANFAKFGEPTRSQAAGGDNISLASERWPEYKDKRQYFELNSDYIRVGRGPRSKQCAFWAQYLPQLIQSFDKNNQCQVVDNQRLFEAVGRTQHRYSPSLPVSGRTKSIPSVTLVTFIVILILIAVAGTLVVVFKKRPSWKLNLWPGFGGGAGGGGNGNPSTGAATGTSGSVRNTGNDNDNDDEEDDDDDSGRPGAGRRSKRAGKSRGA